MIHTLPEKRNFKLFRTGKRLKWWGQDVYTAWKRAKNDGFQKRLSCRRLIEKILLFYIKMTLNLILLWS